MVGHLPHATSKYHLRYPTSIILKASSSSVITLIITFISYYISVLTEVLGGVGVGRVVCGTDEEKLNAEGLKYLVAP